MPKIVATGAALVVATIGGLVFRDLIAGVPASAKSIAWGFGGSLLLLLVAGTWGAVFGIGRRLAKRAAAR